MVSKDPVQHPKITWVKWKSGLVEDIIKDFDVVLIPTTKHPWTKCKSPNRAVDAIHSGKLVITDNKEIYGSLGEYIEIIDNPFDLNDVLSNYDEAKVRQKIKFGQKFITNEYSDEKILNGWLTVFKDLGLVKDVKKVIP